MGLKKIPRKGISNHPPPIRHHTIAAEIHRPDLLLRHLESHHHQPPGDSSFESTTFACGAFVIEICVTIVTNKYCISRKYEDDFFELPQESFEPSRFICRSLWSFVLIHWSKFQTSLPPLSGLCHRWQRWKCGVEGIALHFPFLLTCKSI